MTTHSEKTVGELAAQSLAATRVFEDHGIDFCCGGAKPFEEACREKRLDPGNVLREVELAIAKEAAAPQDTDWNTAPFEKLIDHIVTRHHSYLREELPRLASWIAAVRRAHGQRDGVVLEQLDMVFAAMKDELDQHIRKEEVILFPAILRSEGWISQPIAMMEYEHDSAGRALAELRRLTENYQLPAHACATYRALYAGLAALEADLHVHIHLENNILFPRAKADTNRSRGC
ncbi:MAG: iron-sulfur cluster repair di-iron protein [Bryobacteraceae bacterium]